MQVLADVLGGPRLRILAAFIVCLTFVAPKNAYALECLVPSVQRDYWWHKEQSETYMLVYGSFSDFQSIDTNYENGVLGPIVWSARFEGFKASQNAFDQPFETDVSLLFDGLEDSAVIAQYARSLPESTGLVWMQETEDGYVGIENPCSPMVDTDPAHVKPALRCLRGGYCPKPD